MTTTITTTIITTSQYGLNGAQYRSESITGVNAISISITKQPFITTRILKPIINNKIGKYENRNGFFIEISKDNNKRDIGEKNIYEERIKKLEELDKKKDVEITLLKGAIEHMKAEIEKLKDLTNIFNLFYNYICIYD